MMNFELRMLLPFFFSNEIKRAYTVELKKPKSVKIIKSKKVWHELFIMLIENVLLR